MCLAQDRCWSASATGVLAAASPIVVRAVAGAEMVVVRRAHEIAFTLVAVGNECFAAPPALSERHSDRIAVGIGAAHLGTPVASAVATAVATAVAAALQPALGACVAVASILVEPRRRAEPLFRHGHLPPPGGKYENPEESISPVTERSACLACGEVYILILFVNILIQNANSRHEILMLQ